MRPRTKLRFMRVFEKGEKTDKWYSADDGYTIFPSLFEIERHKRDEYRIKVHLPDWREKEKGHITYTQSLPGSIRLCEDMLQTLNLPTDEERVLRRNW